MSAIHSRALRRAAEILGGTRELCDYLQVPAGDLARWLNAREAPPAGIFLKAVDLIVEERSARPQARPAPGAPTRAAGRRGPA